MFLLLRTPQFMFMFLHLLLGVGWHRSGQDGVRDPASTHQATMAPCHSWASVSLSRRARYTWSLSCSLARSWVPQAQESMARSSTTVTTWSNSRVQSQVGHWQMRCMWRAPADGGSVLAAASLPVAGGSPLGAAAGPVEPGQIGSL